MKPLKFFYRFSKGQQKGIIALFLFIVLFQAAYFIAASIDFRSEKTRSEEDKQWLSLQSQIDALKAKKHSSRDTIYPFNPNYLSDYKGYLLGMSLKELDRLSAYRKEGKYINSADDFKKVTGVHDTLLLKLTPYFKFSGKSYSKSYKDTDEKPVFKKFRAEADHNIRLTDINQALEEDLVKVYGVGPYYAKTILRRRSALGAFVSMAQMDDFTDISAEARDELKKRFTIGNSDDIQKININTASLLQLSRFPYFTKDIARSIITERSMNGKLLKINDLLKISGFPVDKEKIIALYLEF
ncbi:helix-hairpin-helix domain-containing protein [Flavobacterium sp. DG1-102-2]|uniref:ComEA family DNA-binding protein n=1 Tax=Flavobacterium sp. DG1-102-2 TaxID=3081663 RepID=UPI0029491F68|nr:helix-hairpin-helix domain-containing protein [Flavobacterium sp. DG1-102-2]MDV6170165.1 helix-hairpin-helix domain-containing protein [Flavobacterium sp. DG1-102-2]